MNYTTSLIYNNTNFLYSHYLFQICPGGNKSLTLQDVEVLNFIHFLRPHLANLLLQLHHQVNGPGEFLQLVPQLNPNDLEGTEI